MEQPKIKALRVLLAAIRQGHTVSIPGKSGQKVTFTIETRNELVAELLAVLSASEPP